MGKNIEIPLPLLKSLFTLLEYWDVSLFDQSVRDDYWHALWILKMKQLKLDMHDAYALMAEAPDDDARHLARMEYLRLKNLLVADS